MIIINYGFQIVCLRKFVTNKTFLLKEVPGFSGEVARVKISKL